MVKKYKSKMRSMSVLTKVGDEIRTIEFKWDLIYPNSAVRGCSFTTADKELQKALEKHEYFGRKLEPNFWTDDIEEVATPVKEEAKEEPKKVKRYKETKE